MVSDKPIFIGLAGTLNAGKDSMAYVLEEKHHFLHVSTSDMIRTMKKRAFGDSPEATLVRNDPYINELRQEKGPGFMVDAIHEDWLKEQDKYPGGFVASGIRAIGEAEAVLKLGGIIIFVDADPEVRYKRSVARQRDSVDRGKTLEEFLAAERSETDADPNDKNIQNLAVMREMADLVLENNYDSVDEFKEESVNKLRDYLSK